MVTAVEINMMATKTSITCAKTREMIEHHNSVD